VIVESPFLDPKLDIGGIGFKTWSPELGNANMIIKDLIVEEL
jgi:hypothetical protein